MTKGLLSPSNGKKKKKVKIVGKKRGPGTENTVLGKSFRYYNFRIFLGALSKTKQQ